jgi:zinc protease
LRKITLSLAVAVLFGCSPSEKEVSQVDNSVAGVTFIEEIKAEAGKTLIPYKKYQLDNGLTLILHEDKSDPLVHVDVTYHVGSGREEIGKSGFAHFFEHMMFQGSENVADEQHFKLVTEAGGTMNGTTNTDRTNYYQTVPANQLEKMLWLEADRMGFLVDAVTQEKFEVQRETVKNERGQRVDNRPYGRLWERVSQALYPVGHPYSWPVIGYMEDLNRADLNDLKRFFLKWYGPNNATLTIGGDFDEKKSLEMVVKYFGSIPTGPETQMPAKAMVTLDADRYISMEDNVQLPLIYMSFPTVHGRHADEAPLDILSQILGGGKTSIFYKNLQKTQFAVQASVSHPCSELSCTFNMLALPHPASGKTLADLEKIMRDSLAEFEQRGVEQDDLDKVKAAMEARMIFGLQSVSGKVSQLAANETFVETPNYIEQEMARYANVSKEDVNRVYKKYLKGKGSVIMSIVPNGQIASIAAKDNFEPPVMQLVTETETSNDDLALRKAKDSFDRSKIPVAGANAPVDVPQMWQQEMANGIKVLGAQSIETPTTSLLLKIPAGHYHEAKEKAGTLSLLTQMLNESTTNSSPEEMAKKLELLGSSISFSAGNEYMNVNISSLTKNLDATLALAKEKLLQPAFKAQEFARVQANSVQGILTSKKDAGYLASTAYRELLNADNIAATPTGGTEETVKSLLIDDVKMFHSTYVKPAGSELIVVSDMDEKGLMKSLSVFDSWTGKAPKLELDIVTPSTKMGVVYLVNKDEAAQSAIRIGRRGMKEDITGEFYKATLMNFVLGGAFNSRINLNLREDKGYTYGARSYFWGTKLTGGYSATAQVRADATDKSIVEFVNEIKNYQENGITDVELEFMRNAINQGDALKYETPRAKLRFLGKILEHDLTPKFVADQAEIVEKITAKEINELAAKHLKIEEMLILVVGDAKTLKPQLEALGYEVIDYSI